MSYKAHTIYALNECRRYFHLKLFKRLLLASTLFVICAAPALADTVTFSGTTVGSDVLRWNRPSAGTPPTTVSQLGTAVPFSVQQFSVDAPGTYLFRSVAGNFDNFTLLYQNVFAATLPLVNVLVGNDDDPLPGVSGFTFSLVANSSYFFVTTGFDNSEFGAFTNTITGPGAITLANDAEPIPEPATLLLLASGLVGVAVRNRKLAARSVA